MAEGKNKIIVYADWIDKFEELTDEEAGRLIKHFFRYVNDQNPKAPDRLTTLLFADIKATLKRDLEKWEAKSEKSRQSALIRWQKNNANASERTKTDAFYADSDSDSDSDSDKTINSLEGLRIDFQKVYPKGSNPMVILSALQSLPEEERRIAVDYVPTYLKSKPKDLAVMKPENYFKSYCWHDKQETKQETTKHIPTFTMKDGKLTTK